MPENETDMMIRERGNNYGPFEENAVFMQDVKRLMRAHPGWERLLDLHREALDMFAIKIGRIITGANPDYLDNWQDLEGYAKRVQMCIKERRPNKSDMLAKEDAGSISVKSTVDREWWAKGGITNHD